MMVLIGSQAKNNLSSSMLSGRLLAEGNIAL